ncbi:MAG: HPr family phosphocarrier protein [Spirochaetota bacterium]|nr:HPr family phosphocarrier protein [Spirochaetota bacterium]
MAERTAVVKNGAGIHVRPSGVIIGEIKDYPGTITVEANGFSLQLNSVMSLLSLGLVQGDEVRLKVEGPEEEEFSDKLVKLFEKKYDFPKRS